MSNNTLPTDVDPKVLKVEEAAAMLQVPPSWIYAAAKRGAFPCVRVGRYVRIRPKDVEEWIRTGGQADDDE
jgi:excisionase family DNA binding protein